jgi:hypothetical protein
MMNISRELLEHFQFESTVMREYWSKVLARECHKLDEKIVGNLTPHGATGLSGAVDNGPGRTQLKKGKRL